MTGKVISCQFLGNDTYQLRVKVSDGRIPKRDEIVTIESLGHDREREVGS